MQLRRAFHLRSSESHQSTDTHSAIKFTSPQNLLSGASSCTTWIIFKAAIRISQTQMTIQLKRETKLSCEVKTEPLIENSHLGARDVGDRQAEALRLLLHICCEV